MSNGNTWPPSGNSAKDIARAIVGALTNSCPDGKYGTPFSVDSKGLNSYHYQWLFNKNNFGINIPDPNDPTKATWMTADFDSDPATAIAYTFGPKPPEPGRKAGYMNAQGWLTADERDTLLTDGGKAALLAVLNGVKGLNIWDTYPKINLYDGIVAVAPSVHPPPSGRGPEEPVTTQYY